MWVGNGKVGSIVWRGGEDRMSNGNFQKIWHSLLHTLLHDEGGHDIISRLGSHVHTGGNQHLLALAIHWKLYHLDGGHGSIKIHQINGAV